MTKLVTEEKLVAVYVFNSHFFSSSRQKSRVIIPSKKRGRGDERYDV